MFEFSPFPQEGIDLPVWALLKSKTQNNNTLGQGV